MKKLLIFSFALIVSHLALCQHSQIAYLRLADSLYLHHNYQEAAVYYEHAIKNSKQSGNIMLKVARSYSEINNAKAAEPWYRKAKINGASFSKEDTYHYVKAMMMLEMRKEAKQLLRELLKVDQNDLYARQVLDDLLSVGKYYNDSSDFHVTPLSINTAVAEFAPAFYKDGIVFSSAQPQLITKKKYHWDNTHFLKLYYSAKISDHNFQKPVIFDKEIDTRFHDGPIVFYENDQRMILNRNQQATADEKEEVLMSHLSLFDVNRDSTNKSLEFIALPFDEPPYSFAHPSISDDGSILYFISDKPGGYGGTDIYRSIRTAGKWSTPLNLGPSINTLENETFPFFIDDILYFASDGHGGVGGLDLFKSVHSVNGFSPPVNLGYPINSYVDDFSLITTKDQQSGYFSSARRGNDDLFEFRRLPEVVSIAARIYDGATKESLPSAEIKLITMIGGDSILASGSGGNVRFELPRETAYILVASKDGKLGMFSSLATEEEDHRHVVHQIPVYGDTTIIPCIGKIENEFGVTQNVSKVNIIDETTGKRTTHTKNESLVSFSGEKGHNYRIEIQNEQGDTVVYKLEIKPEDTGSKTWSMVLKETSTTMTLAARVFNGDTNAPLGGADVTIITFDEHDQELKANENGIVDFSLPVNAAYIVVGSKDGLTGMASGIAEKGMDKNSIIHPVPAKGDPHDPISVVALVTNLKGEILPVAKATITNKATGENIPGEIKNGILTFFGEKGKEYNIAIEHEGFQPSLQELSIDEDAASIEKIAVVLEEIKPTAHLMTARVVKETDQSPMGAAKVKVITFSQPDLDLTAGSDGVVEFAVVEGEGYILAADKDGFTGMHMGVSEAPKDTISNILVFVNNDPSSMLQIFGMIRDESGAPITDGVVVVTDVNTGEKIPAKVEKGILSFYGKRGGNYRLEISAENYASQEKFIPLDSLASISDPLVINLNKQLPVTAKVTNKRGEILPDAVVTITDKTTGEKIPGEIKNGELTFVGEQGKQYDITVEHKDYQAAVEELVIPQQATAVEQRSFALVEKSIQPITYLMAVRAFKQEDQSPLHNAQIKIMSFSSSDIEIVANEEGVAEFTLPEGSAYIVVARKDEYLGMHSGVAEKGMDKITITHPVPATNDPDKQLPIFAFIVDENGKPLAEAHVEVTDNTTGQKVEAKLENGILTFFGKKGGDYKVVIISEEYETQTEDVKIAPDASLVDPLEISVTRKKLLALSATSNLIILNNETPRLYITSDNSHDEIIEKDGALYLQGKEETKLIGKGSLSALVRDPHNFIQLAPDQAVTMQNIYFDFNSAELDEIDRQELDKAKVIMDRYPLLQLSVRAHADLRGSNTYNLNLTRKRARTIRSYLVKHGIRSRNIFTRAYGKSVPAIVCETKECSEQQHQKNRRAEFALTTLRKVKLETAPVVKPQAATARSTARTRLAPNYAKALEKYGDRQREDLAFKVCVGAYKLNPDLTFTELTDLGQVEKQLVAGINYYYLHDYPTLKTAEDIRQQVIQRGISDAYIVIFYKHDKITFSKFISVTEGE